MRHEPLGIPGATLLRADVHEDDRGSFRRVVDVTVLRSLGLDTAIDQVSVATNTVAGTVRGLHYQEDPHAESKTVWCAAGSVFDVLVDLRTEQPTYGTWISVLLSANDGTALHVPRGVAHGYQTLVDGTSLAYLISTPFHAESARSIRWDDPTLNIAWPLSVTAMSARDREAAPWRSRP